MSWSDDRAVDAVHWQILRNHLKPNVWPVSREMLKYKQELDAARHSDLNQLASVVQEMKNKLSYLKKTASDVNKIKTVGFENFRRDIKTFESKLSKLKEGGSKKLREESLKQLALIEEIDRAKQLAQLHDDVGSKSSRDAGAVGRKKKETHFSAKRVPISKNTYCSKEIAEFHDFCARNYGLTGGWTSKDHEIFLKIRSKHVDGANFIDHVVQAMPHITKDAAREHENWFVKFEELKAKQKEAIIKWKNEKKNIVMYNNDSNTSHPLKKCADNVPEISLKISNDQLEKQTNDSNALQCEIVESKKLDNFDKMLLKRFREKDKKYIESKKTSKRLEVERASDSITVVTLHGKSEKYDDMESLEKLPNLHFSIYGAHNPDLKVVLKYQ